MAALADTIQKSLVRKGSGQLVQQTTQDLAADRGLVAPPLTPGGATSMGANPDQAKMAGTPAQKDAALQESATGTLQEAMRRKQTRTAATGAEGESKEKAEKLGGLRDFGDSAQKLIDAATSNIGGAVSTSAAYVSDTSKALGVSDPTTAKQIDSLFLAYQAATTDADKQAKLAAIAKLTKMTADDATKRLDALASSTGAQQTAVGTAAAAGIQDTASVSDLISKGGLAYKVEDLAGLLGVDPTQLGNMSLSDFQKQIAAMEQAEYSKADDLRGQLGAVGTGQAEQAVARQTLQDMGGTGTAAAEQNVGNIEQAVATGGTVDFGGQSYKVEDLLRDETISGIVKDFFTNPTTAATLREKQPEFAKWLDANAATLSKAVTNLQTDTKALAAKAAANNKIAVSFGISPALFAKLMPGYSDFDTLDMTKAPVILQRIVANPTLKQAIGPYMQDDGVMTQLANSTPAELDALHIGEPNSGWDRFVRANDAVKQIQASFQNIQGVDQVLDTLFGKDVDTNTVQTQLRELKADSLWNPNSPYRDYEGFLDENGNLRSEGELKKLAGAGTSYSLDDARRGAPVPTGFQPKQPITNDTYGGEGRQRISQKLGPALADGVITTDELGNSGLSVEELAQMADQGFGSGFSPELKGKLGQMFQQKKVERTNDLIKKMPEIPGRIMNNPQQIMDFYKDEWNAISGGPDARHVDQATFSDFVNKAMQNSRDSGGFNVDDLFGGQRESPRTERQEPKGLDQWSEASIRDPGKTLVKSIKESGKRLDPRKLRM